MNFGEALEHLKAGAVVGRHSWAGRVPLLVVPGLTIQANDKPLTNHFPVGDSVHAMPYIAVKVGYVLVPWAPAYGDMLADDWEVIALNPPAPGNPPPKVRKKKR